MWVFTINSFVSIVAHRHEPGWLLVRGRFAGDVDLFLGRKCEQETPDADYRFRAVATRAEVALALQKHVRDMTYDNFKNSIPASQDWRSRIAHAVWAVLHQAQQAMITRKASK